MIDTKETGIYLQDMMPLDEVTTIDWDVVLCHFMWVRARSEQEEELADTIQDELSANARDDHQ